MRIAQPDQKIKVDESSSYTRNNSFAGSSLPNEHDGQTDRWTDQPTDGPTDRRTDTPFCRILAHDYCKKMATAAPTKSSRLALTNNDASIILTVLVVIAGIIVVSDKISSCLQIHLKSSRGIFT